MHQSIELLHHTKGRSRFSVPHHFLNRTKELLQNFEPSKTVQINPFTKNITVHYNSDLDELLNYLHKHKVSASLRKNVLKTSDVQQVTRKEENLGDHLRKKITSLNKAVEEKSAGQITLKGVVLITLVGLGIYQIVKNRKILPAGLNLLMFAGNLLMKTGDLPLTEDIPEFDPHMKVSLH